VAPAAAALIAVLAACGSDGSADPSGAKNEASSPTSGADEAAQEPRTNELISDAAAPSAPYRGSPLCHINAGTCDPDDDDGTKASANYAAACALPPAPDSGVATSSKGCRLAGATAAPTCLDADPAGTDGSKCATGADCAAGFDCVTSGDVGYCRRYCCSGSCGTHRSQNGAETFCDVQKLENSDVKAPVCMPIKTCKLLTVGDCADNETCSVVTDTGITGCVANGTAKAGEGCDQEHCSAGLTCLGQAGSRKCFQLCRTKTGPACASNEICKPNPIFTDPTIGVCAPAQ
jgi:hypothetical protein